MATQRKYATDPWLLERARELRANQTKAEHLLWYFLRGRRLEGLRFRRQETIGRTIVDFYCHEAKLAVELDGGQHVSSAVEDEERSAFLASRGIEVLRFWNNEALGQTPEVLQQIVDVAQARIASSTKH